jgi:diguanylate cyclase
MVDSLKKQTKLLLGETQEMIKVWTAAKGEVTIPREEHERLLRLLQGHQANTELLMAAREKLQLELREERKLARIDVVTGQPNRKAFEEHLGRELSEIAVPEIAADGRSGQARTPGKNVSVIIVDLDEFKPINDRFGHKAGDLHLRTVGETASRVIRPSDLIARTGGDEFGLVVNGGAAAAAVVVHKIRSAFGNAENWTIWGGARLPLKASFGIAECQPSDTVVSAMERADEAMYAEKHRKPTARRPAGSDTTLGLATDKLREPGVNN